MLKRSLLAASLIAVSISNVHALPYGFYDARSVAMGNTSVATGGITTAAFSNQGMLSINENRDKFALLIPAIGALAIEDGNIIDLVDEFQEIGTPTTPEEINRQIEILNELDGGSIVAAVVPATAFVYSGENITWGIALRANVVVSSTITDVSTALPNPDAVTRNLGVAISEIGLPVGTDFSFAGMKVGVGVTPRYVQVNAIEYVELLSNASFDDIRDRDTQDLGNFTTFDAGITLNIIDTFRVGFVAKNLIEETKTTSPSLINPNGSIINFETQYRVGASFDGGFFTLAADFDLAERTPIGFENPSQSLSIGAEFDAFSVAQLRVGYQSNLASGATDPDLLSVGVGFWFGFNLDVAVVAGDDSSFGAFIQTGFHF